MNLPISVPTDLVEAWFFPSQEAPTFDHAKANGEAGIP